MTTTIQDPQHAFARVVCVNLDRRPDRWRRFAEGLPADWPFVAPARWPAIDGQRVTPPPWWGAGRGAWGVYRSQLAILERCLNEGADSVLILEDDALCCPDFSARVTGWLRHVPADWHCLYLGGQHLRPPRQLDDWLYQPQNVNRCHAWAVRGPMIAQVYQHLADMPWPPCDSGKPAHIDHHLGRLHQRCFDAADRRVLCPPAWFIGQASDTKSNISGRENLPDRFWQPAGREPPAASQPVIAVLGPFRGGTSCCAGLLHHLGVSMGQSWSTIRGNPRGTYEARHLAQFCRRAYREHDMTPQLDYQGRVDGLRRWLHSRRRSVTAPTPIGAKHPALCLMVPEVLAAWPAVQFVVIRRPLDESVASLRKLGWGWPPDSIEPTLRRMIETRDQDLAAVSPDRVLAVDYDDLLANPAAAAQRLADFAGVRPTPDQLAAALATVDPALRHQRGSA